MRTVDINVARVHLSRLLDEVAAGEEIVFVEAGERPACLLPIQPGRQPRKPDLLRGEIWIADDFDDPLPEDVMAAFRGERP